MLKIGGQQSTYDSQYKRLGIPIEKNILISIEDYIRNGDGWDIVNNPYVQTIDINRSALIRFLISAYGDKETIESISVINHLYTYPEEVVNITVNSTNTRLLDKSPRDRKHSLITAMIYIGIPIRGLFDGRRLLFSEDAEYKDSMYEEVGEGKGKGKENYKNYE